MRRRLVHFYYAALTLRHVPDHFDALRNENAMLRAKLFDRANSPWEGDTVSLKHSIIQARQNCPMALAPDLMTPPTSADSEFPVEYSPEETNECIAKHEQEAEKLQELAEMKELIGIDSVGWVPDDEHLGNAKNVRDSIKAGLLEHSSSEAERIAVLHHFPFEDHVEENE